MRSDKKYILGIGFSNMPKDNILEYCSKWLRNSKMSTGRQEKGVRESFIIVTPNPELVVYAKSHTMFTKILNQADIAIPDGVGIIMADRIMGGDPLPEKIAGIELMEALVAVASKESVRIGLIGGGKTVALHALECLQKTYPNLIGWADAGPQLSIEYLVSSIEQKSKRSLNTSYSILNTPAGTAENFIKEMALKIKETKTQIVFVGLGAPKQEYFIFALKEELKKLGHDAILMAVGGSFDELSGTVQRAPGWIDKAGFKWLWRLILEPWRWRRQLALVRFVYLVFAHKYFGRL